MQGEVAEEVLRKDEPEITLLRVEADSIFHERMDVNEVFEEDEEGQQTARTITRAARELLMAELKAKLEAEIEQLKAGKKTEVPLFE